MDSSSNSVKKIKQSSFWQSINILITKPHVVNKRLWGCTILKRHHILKSFNWERELDQYKLEDVNIENLLEEILRRLQVQIINDHETDFEVILVELLPKSYLEPHAFQIVCIDKSNIQVTFIDVTPKKIHQNLCPKFLYTFALQNDKIILKTLPDTTEESQCWLKNTVLPQIVKWCNENSSYQTNICNNSLALVPNEKYYTTYNDLKFKYGKEMVKIWPESTDPKKFVYEDIAIATYLLLLWRSDTKPQKFVDIGCGNGLLVYILTMEGHTGYGVDVRKRKIWDLYPDNIKLKEITVTPSNMHIFSEADWVIGNHSDELTPWIPVIATQNSYKCNFFLLPCCAYNFDGSKYQRQNSSKSQYTEYLEYIKQLCDYCGFETKVDRLKIPSTKRICLIGNRKTYKESDYDKHINLVQDMINEQIGLNDNKKDLKEFKTRDPIERVKNCTQLDKNVTETIVKQISRYLLEGCNLESSWSKGKNVTINELVLILQSDNLKALKSECGGIQTLLRNNHHIFEVRNGCVQLRFPRSIEEVKNCAKSKKNNNLNLQIKKCWFFNNHPQGCPLEKSICSFLHEQDSIL